MTFTRFPTGNERPQSVSHMPSPSVDPALLTRSPVLGGGFDFDHSAYASSQEPPLSQPIAHLPVLPLHAIFSWEHGLRRPSARLLLAPTEGLSRTQVIVQIEKIAAQCGMVCCVLENTDMAATHAVRQKIDETIANHGMLIIAAGPGGIENPNAFNTIIDDYASDGEAGKRASQMRVVVVLPTGFLLEDTAFVSRFEAHRLTPLVHPFLDRPWMTPSPQKCMDPSIARIVVWEMFGMDARLEAAFKEAKGELLICVPEVSEYVMRCLWRLCESHPGLRVFVHEDFHDGFISRRDPDVMPEGVLAIDEASVLTAFARESAQVGTSCFGPLSDVRNPAPQVMVMGPLSENSWKMLASAPNPCWPPHVVEGIPVPSWASDVVRIAGGARDVFRYELPNTSFVLHASDTSLMFSLLFKKYPSMIYIPMASDTSAGAFLQRAVRCDDGRHLRVDTLLLDALNKGGDIVLHVDYAPDLAKCMGLLLMTPPRGMVSGEMVEFPNARVILLTNDPHLELALPGAMHLHDNVQHTSRDLVIHAFWNMELSESEISRVVEFADAIDLALKSDPETLARHRRLDVWTLIRVLLYKDKFSDWMRIAVECTLSGEFGDGSESYAKLLYTVSGNETSHDFDVRGVFRAIDDMRHPSQLLDYQYRIANEVTRPVFDAVMAYYKASPAHGLAVLICHAAKSYPPGGQEAQIAQWIADGVGLPADAIMPVEPPLSSSRDLYEEQYACVQRALAVNQGCALIGPPCSGKSRALDMLEKSYPRTVRLVVAHFPNVTLLANAVQEAYDGGAHLVIIDEADLLDLRGIIRLSSGGCKLVIAGNGLQDDRVSLPVWIPLVRFPEVTYGQDLMDRFITPATDACKEIFSGSVYGLTNTTTKLLATHRMMHAMDREGRVTPRLIQEVYRRFLAMQSNGVGAGTWPTALTQVYIDAFGARERKTLNLLFRLTLLPGYDGLGFLASGIFHGREDDYNRIYRHLWVLQKARQLPDHPALRGTSSSFAISGPPGVGKDAMTRAALCSLDGDRPRTWTQVQGGSADVVWAVQKARHDFGTVVVSELNTFNAQAIHAGLHSDERAGLGVVVSLGNPPDTNQGRANKGAAAASRETRLVLEDGSPHDWVAGARRCVPRVTDSTALHTGDALERINHRLIASGSPLRATFRQMVAMFENPSGNHLDYYDAVIESFRGKTAPQNITSQSSSSTIALLSAIAGVPVRFLEGSRFNDNVTDPVLASDGSLVFPGQADPKVSFSTRRHYACFAVRLGVFEDRDEPLMSAWLCDILGVRGIRRIATHKNPTFARLWSLVASGRISPTDDALVLLFYQRIKAWSKDHILARSPASARAFGYHVRKVFSEVERALSAGEPLNPHVFMTDEEAALFPVNQAQPIIKPVIDPKVALLAQLAENTEVRHSQVRLTMPPQRTTLRDTRPELTHERERVAPTVIGVRYATSTLYCPAYVQDPDGTHRTYPLASPNAGASKEIDRHVVAVTNAPGTMIALRVHEGAVPVDICFSSNGKKIPVRELEPDVDVVLSGSSYAVRVPQGLVPGSNLSYRLVEATKPKALCRNGHKAVDTLDLRTLPDDRRAVVESFLLREDTIRIARSVKHHSKAVLVQHVCDWVKTTFQYRWGHEQGATTAIEMLRTGSGNCVAAQELAFILLVRLGARSVLRIAGTLLQGQEIKSSGHVWLEYEGGRYDPTPFEVPRAQPVLARPIDATRVAMRAVRPVEICEPEAIPVVLVRAANIARLNDLQKQRMNDPRLRARWLASECLFQQTVMAKSVTDPHGDEVRITASGDVVPCTRAGKVSPKPRVLFLGSRDAVRMAAEPLGLWLPALAVFFEEGRGRLYIACKHADGHSDITCVKSCEELLDAVNRVPKNVVHDDPRDELAIAMGAKTVTYGAQVLRLDALRSEAVPKDAGSRFRRDPPPKRHSVNF